jgi:hypothetical protein
LIEKKTPPDLLSPHHLRPRVKNLTSVLFKSLVLKRLVVDDCFNKQVQHLEFNLPFYTKIFPRFITKVLAGQITKAECINTEVYRWQRQGDDGSTPWSHEIAKERTEGYFDMVLSMKDHGQEQPICLQECAGMRDPWDGFHRVAVLHYLHKKYVYGEDICLDQT